MEEIKIVEKRQIDWGRFAKLIGIGIGIIVLDFIWWIIMEFDEDFIIFVIPISMVGILFIRGAIATIGQYIAEEKGYSDMHVFALCFWLGTIGWLVVIALPDRILAQVIEKSADMIKKESNTVVKEVSRRTGNIGDELPDL
jgi:membrane-bound ClpP family serine protease